MFNSIRKAKLKVAGIMFAGIVVAGIVTNIDLVQSVQDLWKQEGQTVKMVNGADRTLHLEGALTLDGASVFGSDITVTTTNTATSSISVGCIETYATSTETVLRLSATTTPGAAMWTYGACSEL